MKKNLLITWALALPFLGLTQKIHFCENFPSSYEPSDTSHLWRVSNEGGYLFLQFSVPYKFNSSLFHILLNDLESDTLARDTLPFYVDPRENRAVYELFIKGEGTKEVGILDSLGKLITIDTIRLELSNMNEVSSHFRDAELEFCDSTNKGKSINPGHTFALGKGPREVMALLRRPGKIGESQVTVGVFKWEKEEWKLLSSVKYKLNYFWEFTQIPLRFREPGRYLVEIYTRRGVSIAGGQLEIRE